MKTRLPQAEAGSTGRPSYSDRSHDLFLGALHFGRGAGILIIKTAQMKKAMRDIELQLMLERGPEAPRLASRGFRADKNLAVLKSDHVGGSRLLKKAPMQFRHAAIGNENDA